MWRRRGTAPFGAFVDECGEVVGAEAERAGLGDERSDEAVGEGSATLGEQLLAGAGGDEHADAAALDEHTLVDEHVHSFRCGGGVDAVEGGEFVGRGGAGVLREGAVDDRLLDALCDLQEERPTLLDHAVFVYLLPAIFLFSVGVVPGIVATILFAVAPGVRLTELGIRGVDAEVVEAGQAFGATPGRILRQIQLPLALPSIMAGINQIIMLSLSMSVIASMVGAPGLGRPIVQALSSVNIPLGFEAGLAVVVIAMILDRITGALGAPRRPRRPAAAVPGATAPGAPDADRAASVDLAASVDQAASADKTPATV